MQITLNLQSNSGTTTNEVNGLALAYFDFPTFGFLKQRRIYFYSREDIAKFLKKLPKDWLERIISP